MQSAQNAAVSVLLTANALDKADAARALYQRWQTGQLDHQLADTPVPDRPARAEKPELLLPRFMPRRRKGNTPKNRFALIHAITHIELNAIDLALDAAARFGPTMPRAFTDDWLRIASEEAKHFQMLHLLLEEAGGAYGDLPAHDGMWDSAYITRHDLLARLAIVPQVLEARGLDVTPAMITRFKEQDDHAAVAAFEVILAEEIGHVEAGNRWFRYLCRESGHDPIIHFRDLVSQTFTGSVKPPFNDSARRQAGLTMDWYTDLGFDPIPDK